MKIVAVGDLHLDASTSGVDRFEDICKVLDQAAEHAIKIKADAFVFLGDLADPHTVRVHRAVRKLAEVQHRVHCCDITPVFIAGNHDVIEDGSGGSVIDVLDQYGLGMVLTRPEAFYLDSRSQKQADRVQVLALPFTPSCANYDPDAFVRAQNIDPDRPVLVIGHLNLEGISAGSETTDMPRGRDVFWPIQALKDCCPDALLVGGHYHTPQEFKGVHIVGSAVRLRMDEKDGSPGFSVLEV